MSSILSCVFSTSTVSDRHAAINDINPYDIDFHELVARPSSNSHVLASAFNLCYRNALLELYKDLEELEQHPLPSAAIPLSAAFAVSEDDFDATVYPNRSFTPHPNTIAQWRHESFTNPKFNFTLRLLVAAEMRAILVRWTELELQITEERNPTSDRTVLNEKLYTLKTLTDPIDIDMLIDLSNGYEDTLIEQVDWKSIVTKMRSNGGFKYFDESSLRRMWKHRCQYGDIDVWSDDLDNLLRELVEQFGFGQWVQIAQHEMFKTNKKSAFMCAQRYMSQSNKQYAKRRFTQDEKDSVLAIHKHRCSVIKDYRFAVSYAAFVLGDRGIRELSHMWTYLNPDVQKGGFKAEEDALLLEHAAKTSPICWSTLAATYLSDRSAAQCRQRYQYLIGGRSRKKKTVTTAKTTTSRSSKATTE